MKDRLRTLTAWGLCLLCVPILGTITAALYLIAVPAFIWRAWRGVDESWWSEGVHQGRYKRKVRLDG